LTIINGLPDEVLLEIFDFYRQGIIYRQGIVLQYDDQWRKKYGWFNLAHVCRRWRAVMLASSSRLDINIVVGPEKPDNIKTILSGHLPILIDYLELWNLLDIVTDNALWRMRAALGHRDRVREISISFGAGYGAMFDKFIKATTNCHFPALEILVLDFPSCLERDIPATFLRGPDRSDLPLRCLRLFGSSLESASRLLLSATALTELTLKITSLPAVFDPSQGSFLLSCLQGTQCLRHLDLTTPYDFRDHQSQDSIATPKDIVPLLKLTRFHFSGPTTFLNDFMCGLSAPSLQDARFWVDEKSPVLYLSRAIDDVSEEFRSVSVTFNRFDFDLVSSTNSGEVDHFKPASFKFNMNSSPYSINSINSTPSTKLAMVEELTLNFFSSNYTYLEDVFSLREFLRQFRSVRLLRVNPFVWQVGRYLKQDDDGEAVLPVLEQVELSIPRSARYSGEYQRHAAEALAAFESCERGGRLVKVNHSEQTQTQSRNARSMHVMYY
jgi:hypothetical protein